jgi:hypothetical protein
MSFVTALLTAAETEQHVQLPIPTWLYGVIALVAFTVLAIVLWSFKDVSNRHALQGDAYAAAHGGTSAHGAAGHGGH